MEKKCLGKCDSTKAISEFRKHTRPYGIYYDRLCRSCKNQKERPRRMHSYEKHKEKYNPIRNSRIRKRLYETSEGARQLVDRNSKLASYDPYEYHLSQRVKIWKYHAVKRGYIWNVSLDNLIELLHKQSYKCYLTGRPLETVKGYMQMSLDRIDNRHGYELGNVALCGQLLNRMKLDTPLTDFIALCREVSQNEMD